MFVRLKDDKPSANVHPVRIIETTPESSKRYALKNTKVSEDLLSQLDSRETNLVLDVEAQKISLNNLDKAFWPGYKGTRAVTKRDLIKYLVKVSPYLLPHLKDRPLSLSRYPNGIYGQHFFQKHYRPVPDFVETVLLSFYDTPQQQYLLCNNLATLLWLGQIADIELHTWFSRVKPGDDFKADLKRKKVADYYADYPDFLIFDIDPYIYSGQELSGQEPELNRTAFSKTCQVASTIKQTLDKLSCPLFVKTSGKTGLHVFIPIVRRLDFQGTHAIARHSAGFCNKSNRRLLPPIGRWENGRVRCFWTITRMCVERH